MHRRRRHGALTKASSTTAAGRLCRRTQEAAQALADDGRVDLLRRAASTAVARAPPAVQLRGGFSPCRRAKGTGDVTGRKRDGDDVLLPSVIVREHAWGGQAWSLFNLVRLTLCLCGCAAVQRLWPVE